MIQVLFFVPVCDLSFPRSDQTEKKQKPAGEGLSNSGGSYQGRRTGTDPYDPAHTSLRENTSVSHHDPEYADHEQMRGIIDVEEPFHALPASALAVILE